MNGATIELIKVVIGLSSLLFIVFSPLSQKQKTDESRSHYHCFLPKRIVASVIGQNGGNHVWRMRIFIGIADVIRRSILSAGGTFIPVDESVDVPSIWESDGGIDQQRKEDE